MSEHFVTPIRGRRLLDSGRYPVPFLHLEVEGEYWGLPPSSATFKPLSPRKGELYPSIHRVGWGPVYIPFWHPNQVKMQGSQREQGEVLDGPVWDAFHDYAAGFGLELNNRTLGVDAAVWTLPETELTLDTGVQRFQVDPARLVAAGLRLVHAHHNLGNP